MKRWTILLVLALLLVVAACDEQADKPVQQTPQGLTWNPPMRRAQSPTAAVSSPGPVATEVSPPTSTPVLPRTHRAACDQPARLQRHPGHGLPERRSEGLVPRQLCSALTYTAPTAASAVRNQLCIQQVTEPFSVGFSVMAHSATGAIMVEQALYSRLEARRSRFEVRARA